MRTAKHIKPLVALSGMVLLTFTFIASVSGQTDKKYIRKGNREYEKNKFSDSEILYRKASDNNKQNPDALFNVGDALYRQNKFEEAGKQFLETTSQNENKAKKSAGFYNLGNSLLKANKFEESIEAYKNSLKLTPGNREAKYNLAYAQDLLKKQQQQQQQQQNQSKQDKNKDKDKNKQDQKKDQQNKDNQQQQKDQDNKQDKNQQKQEQNQQISKDDAQRLLNSLANDEKNVQEKVKLAKANKTKVRSLKNW